MATIAQFVKNPAALDAYKKWLAEPMTQEMLEMARTMSAPLGLPVSERTGERALYYAGQTDGSRAIYDLLSNLSGYVEQQLATARAEGLLKEADYGWQAVQKESEHVGK